MYGLKPSTTVIAIAAVVIAVLVHIEMQIATRYAPEAVLVRVYDAKGHLEVAAQCYGDISSAESNVKKKPLRALLSIYDFLNPSSFLANTESGFHLLETGLENYQGIFEIRIVCYSENLRGVSYTIVNNENQKNCRLDGSGRILVC